MPAVIGPFDPRGDCQSEFLAGLPLSYSEDAVLNHRVKRSHQCVVTGGADSTHRANESVVLQHHDEVPTSKLRSSVGVGNGSLMIPQVNDVAQGRGHLVTVGRLSGRPCDPRRRLQSRPCGACLRS